jgi:hypothetical protein
MHRSLTLLLLVLTVSLTGVFAPSPALAAGRPHAAQGRGNKKAHKAKSPKKDKASKPEASRAAKKNDRGFEL